MFKETETMKELHKIREEIYNETRHLKTEDKIAFIEKEASKVRQQMTLKQTVRA